MLRETGFHFVLIVGVGLAASGMLNEWYRLHGMRTLKFPLRLSAVLVAAVIVQLLDFLFAKAVARW